MENENRAKEEKLIKRLIPKISEYFQKNEILTKENFADFLDFIDLSSWSENENKLWKQISKNAYSNQGVKKTLLIKNLTEYIHSNSKDLFQPGASLTTSMSQFFNTPVKLIEDIDSDNELMYELYRLLATLEYSDSKSIPLHLLETNLNKFKFIHLNKETIIDLLTELLKGKVTSIRKPDYLEIMDKMYLEYSFKFADMAKKKKIFPDEELDTPELATFIYLQTFVNILLKLSESVVICHEKNLQFEKKNEKLQSEYFNRSFNVLTNNMKLYFYEILRIFFEQKQKFEYFDCSLTSKLTILKQENANLSNEIKQYEEKNTDNKNEKLMKILQEQINEEKNKVNEISIENKNLKKELEQKEEKVSLYNNQITEFKKKQTENENTINRLEKEKNIETEKYNDVLAKYNSQLFIQHEKNRKTNDAIKNMQLKDSLKNLISMNKEELIFFISEKDKNFSNISDENKTLKNKVNELEKIKEKDDNEIDELKSNNLSLQKKHDTLFEEFENYKKEKENSKNGGGVLLGDFLGDDEMEKELNEEKEKVKDLNKNIENYKKMIEKFKEDLSKKDEELVQTKNKLLSQDSNIKENNNKINKLNESLENINKKYDELLNKYNSELASIEEKEKKTLEAINNMNLTGKHQNLINMNKEQLIQYIVEKDKYYSTIEENNNNYKNKIDELEKIKLQNENEINNYKVISNSTNKKFEMLNKENSRLKAKNEKSIKDCNDLQMTVGNQKTEIEKLNKIKNEFNEKNKKLEDENQELKNEILKQNETINKLKNDSEAKRKENEEKINVLTKENDMLNRNYSELFNKFNDQLAQVKKSEDQTREAIKNMNLSGAQKNLINMSKEELILFILEKEKYIATIENLNKNQKLKLESLETAKSNVEKELTDLKTSFSDLDKKISLLNTDISHLKTENENLKNEKNEISDKLQKMTTEKDNLEKLMNNEKAKVNKLMAIIENYKKEKIAKDEKIQNATNKINSLNNQIKENEQKLNEITTEKENLNQNYSELFDKFNDQLAKIKNNEKKDIEAIQNLNLPSKYNNLINMDKVQLISLILEKDKLCESLEEAKSNLKNELTNLETKIQEKEKLINEHEITIENLNNKNELLSQENIGYKKDIESADKEKENLISSINDDKKKKLVLRNKNEELVKETNKLQNQIKNLEEEIEKKNELLSKAKNKYSNNLKEKEDKIDSLTNLNEKINKEYKELLDKFNIQKINLNKYETQKQNALKKIDEKYKNLVDMPLDELIFLIIEKDKNISNLTEDNKNLKTKLSNILQKYKKVEDLVSKFKELKTRAVEMKKQNEELNNNIITLKKQLEEYQKKYNELLDSVINEKDNKKLKNNLITIINTTQFTLSKKKIIKKPKVYTKEKIYDYLCMKMDEKIIQNLDDSYFDPNSNLMFTELINYIDKEDVTECAVLITAENFYLLNSENHKKCYSIPINLLTKIDVSNISNFVTLEFGSSQMVTFEIFRILELVEFFKTLQARFHKTYRYKISVNQYNNKFVKSKNKNFTECLYYGKAIFSGHLKMHIEGIFSSSLEERFAVLCEIGLILLESPVGKPVNIINLLFADINSFNNSDGFCLSLIIGKHLYTFVFDSAKIREFWENQIKVWKNNTSSGKSLMR